MPGGCDRSAPANELLLLRNAIVQEMASGWAFAPAYHISTITACRIRIGEDPFPATATVADVGEVATVAVNEPVRPSAGVHLVDEDPPAPVAAPSMGEIRRKAHGQSRGGEYKFRPSRIPVSWP